MRPAPELPRIGNNPTDGDLFTMTTTKLCSQCFMEKPLDCFYHNKSQGGKPGAYCKPCNKLRCKAWRDANPEKVKANNKAWRDANPEKVKADWQTYYQANRSTLIAQKVAYRQSQ